MTPQHRSSRGQHDADRASAPTGSRPVAISVQWDGCTLRQYDLLLASLELSPGGRPLPRCLVHWAEADASGILVREVWSDRAMCELVLVDFILPAASLLGLPVPRVELKTVECFLIGDGHDGPAERAGE